MSNLFQFTLVRPSIIGTQLDNQKKSFFVFLRLPAPSLLRRYFNPLPILPIFFFVFISCRSPQKSHTNSPVNPSAYTLPISLRFKNQSTPDSIKDFIKTYLQFKKFTIASESNSIELMMEEMGKRRDEIFKLKDNGAVSVNELSQKILKLCNVVCNLLILDFNSTGSGAIDSIKWRVVRLPPKDSMLVTTYKPDNLQKGNIYNLLKDFIDKVITSNYLN